MGDTNDNPSFSAAGTENSSVSVHGPVIRVKNLVCHEVTRGNTVRTVKFLTYQESTNNQIISTDIYNELINGTCKKFIVTKSPAKKFSVKIPETEPKTERKTAEEPVPQVPEINNQKTKWQLKNIFISAILVLLISIYVYIHFRTEPIRIRELQYDLSDKVMRQTAAIDSLLKNIKLLNELNETKSISCLLGPTGTGKTHAINILKKHVDSRVVQVLQPYEMREFSLYRGTFLEASWYLHFKMVLSDYYIIVIDDLRTEDIQEVNMFIEKTMKFESTNMLIILVFNTQYSAKYFDPSVISINSNIIKTSLRIINDNVLFSEFNELNQTTVEEWLRKELANNIAHRYHDDVIGKILKIQDFRVFGLKGAEAKVALEIKKYEKM